MSATPYVPTPREVAHFLTVRRWIGTICELAAISVFIAMLAAFGAFG